MFMLLLLSSFLHMMVTPVSLPGMAVADSVREIECPLTDEVASQGSATVISKNMVLTDYHVIYKSTGACLFDGSPTVRVLYANADEDIAVLAVDTGALKPIPISCTGMVPGNDYLALGYPGYLNHGYDARLVVTGKFPNLKFSTELVEKPPVLGAQLVVATAVHIDTPATEDYPFVSHDLTVMLRNVYEGMSGGPILNDQDQITGLVTSLYGKENSANRDLKGTGLCR